MTTIVTKKSSVAGRVPAAQDLVAGELAINLTDRRLYSKDESGEVFRLARQRDPSLYLYQAATSGNYLFMGRLAWDDYPATGDADDATAWTIYRIETNSAGIAIAELSAEGAWSNRENLF